jgi:hypothetical protein
MYEKKSVSIDYEGQITRLNDENVILRVKFFIKILIFDVKFIIFFYRKILKI